LQSLAGRFQSRVIDLMSQLEQVPEFGADSIALTAVLALGQKLMAAEARRQMVSYNPGDPQHRLVFVVILDEVQALWPEKSQPAPNERVLGELRTFMQLKNHAIFFTGSAHRLTCFMHGVQGLDRRKLPVIHLQPITSFEEFVASSHLLHAEWKLKPCASGSKNRAAQEQPEQMSRLQVMKALSQTGGVLGFMLAHPEDRRALQLPSEGVPALALLYWHTRRALDAWVKSRPSSSASASRAPPVADDLGFVEALCEDPTGGVLNMEVKHLVKQLVSKADLAGQHANEMEAAQEQSLADAGIILISEVKGSGVQMVRFLLPAYFVQMHQPVNGLSLAEVTAIHFPQGKLAECWEIFHCDRLVATNQALWALPSQPHVLPEFRWCELHEFAWFQQNVKKLFKPMPDQMGYGTSNRNSNADA
jgi:hypothetical protein